MPNFGAGDDDFGSFMLQQRVEACDFRRFAAFLQGGGAAVGAGTKIAWQNTNPRGEQ
jgi:hypothetical protein